MEKKYQINISKVNPWWLRLFILIFIGLPPLTGWPINSLQTQDHSLNNIILWLLYGCFIWLFIFINIGWIHLLKYLSLAFTLAILTSMFGVIIRNIPGVFFEGWAPNNELLSYKMLNLFIIMISVIPFGLFFINSFSPSNYIKKSLRRNNNANDFRIHIALGLRVFQHVGEIFINLLLVWREENPDLVKPRFREEWKVSKFSLLKWLKWMLDSSVVWCFALLTTTFESIPYFVNEIKFYTKK